MEPIQPLKSSQSPKNLDFDKNCKVKISYKKNLGVFAKNPLHAVFFHFGPLTSCRRSKKYSDGK